MSTPFHKSSEIVQPPAWFKEENYDNLAKLGVNEFINLVRIRQFSKYEILQSWKMAEDESYVLLMTREPLGKNKGGYFDDYLFSEDRCKGRLKSGNSVSSPSFYTILESLDRGLRHSDVNVQLEALARRVNENKDSLDSVQKELYQLNVNEFIHSGTDLYFDYSFLAVDITAPTEAIIDDFKAWLKTEQKYWSVKKSTFNNEKEMIIENKVFQYFDLHRYFQLKGKKLTHEQYAQILFGSEYGADKIRKTVKPLSLKVMSDKYISWLTHINR